MKQGSKKEQHPEELRVRNEDSTNKVMMYIFPRQFGLHNAFTSIVDTTQTAQKFQDYTMREEEISKAIRRDIRPNGKEGRIQVPKRLRGDARRLVERLQVLHARCSYPELLRHYCPTILDTAADSKPIASSAPGGSTDAGSALLRRNAHEGLSYDRPRGTRSVRKSHKPAKPAPQVQFKSLVQMATPTEQVSAFCRAVLSKLIPAEFWGTGPSQLPNKEALLKNVDHFVKLRRFESMSLHEVIQDMKVREYCILWTTTD
jgi:telomerase reverse transcriptase